VLTRIRALANAEGVINFSGGFPDPELFPTELLAGITERLPAAHSHVALQCAPSQGIATTIAAVSDHLQELERVRRSHDALTITGSGIDAVTLIAKSTLGLTDVVLVEAPSYLGAVAGFAAFKATLHSVDTDADRPDVAALAQLLDGGLRAKLLYTIAYYQNPSGHSLCAARWTQAVELCRRHGCADRRERRVSRTRLLPRPCGAPSEPVVARNGSVVQIGTFSKTFFPGVRLGCAAGPPEVIAQLVVAKQNSDQCAGALGQPYGRGIHSWLYFNAQVTGARALYRRRGEATVPALRAGMPSGVTWTEPTGGLLTWVHVPGVDTAALANAARANDVALVPRRRVLRRAGRERVPASVFQLSERREHRRGHAPAGDCHHRNQTGRHRMTHTHFAAEPTGTPAADGRFGTPQLMESVGYVPGLMFQPVLGESMLADFVIFQPHTEAPLHVHGEEHIAVVVAGESDFTIDGHTRTMRVGDVAVVPPWVSHGAVTRDIGCREIDMFSPPRATLLEHARKAPPASIVPRPGGGGFRLMDLGWLGGGLDVLVNNAGGANPGTLETLPEEAWQRDLDVKLFGQIRCFRAALPHLRQSPGPRVVNINAVYAKNPDSACFATTVNRAACLNPRCSRSSTAPGTSR